MENWTDQEHSDPQCLASSPREDKNKSNKNKLFNRDRDNMSLKREKHFISGRPRKVLLEQLAQYYQLKASTSRPCGACKHWRSGALLAAHLTEHGHRVITTMALADVKATVSISFVSESWREVVERWKSLMYKKLLTAAHRYLTQAQQTLHLPIAEAMLTYKEKSYKMISEGIGQEPLDLQVDYWLSWIKSRGEGEGREKDKTRVEGGKYTLKASFSTLQVARLATTCVAHPFDPTTFMRLGKEGKAMKQKVTEVVDGVSSGVDSAEWTNVKFFQLSSQCRTQIKSFLSLFSVYKTQTCDSVPLMNLKLAFFQLQDTNDNKHQQL
ncbi:Phosphofurin acidic cluster sorting protein 1-like 3 [Homarus americanus]|uniref:Phosphofurin acidic cluster sorting protein 1-like 2 n=1 Tax=Homarus americanus TaxID=6706 RepID=A0A8J5JJ05_HOMAM|nr:Phosphofurin acidic cluster sorting protein 1-like 2 [Homarus americanus]KAG7171143.1 Phosphofurin acidic cluster sorting protein 1-like 3 [Homarus americanus]